MAREITLTVAGGDLEAEAAIRGAAAAASLMQARVGSQSFDMERLEEEPVAEVAAEPVAEEAPEPLDRDAFGSKSAYELAVEAGLTPAAFEGMRPQSSRGYTTADVRGVIG